MQQGDASEALAAPAGRARGCRIARRSLQGAARRDYRDRYNDLWDQINDRLIELNASCGCSFVVALVDNVRGRRVNTFAGDDLLRAYILGWPRTHSLLKPHKIFLLKHTRPCTQKEKVQ